MSVPFPADLVASLHRHDGVARRGPSFTLPFLYHPTPVAQIPAEWQMLCRITTNTTWWHANFLPFASSVDKGNLFTDQRPTGQGRVGDFSDETA
jgi:cell wall assembly regulator SMI1